MLPCLGSFTGDFHPIYNAPMLGAHKWVLDKRRPAVLLFPVMIQIPFLIEFPRSPGSRCQRFHVSRWSRIMKPTTLLLLALASFTHAQSPSLTSIERANALVTETIPHLSLNKATFEQALETVRRIWSEQRAGDQLPIGTTAFLSPQGYRDENPAQITLDLKNVPFIEALKYIADLSGRAFRVRQGLPQFERITWIEEGWVTRVHEITPEVLTHLKLMPDSSATDVRRALVTLGVNLEEWMKPTLIADGSHLGLTSYQAQQEQISGIITLLRNGYKISK
jgi:hypothetical protein